MYENDMYNFFIELQTFVNSNNIIYLYYEEAKKTAKFPYGVISNPTETYLRYGKLVYFDIYIWSKNPEIGVDLEKKVQSLINLLDRHIFSEQNAVIYFETQKPVSDPEFELIKKQLSFSIRLF